MKTVSFLPVMIVLLPLVATAIIYSIERYSWKMRNLLSVVASLASFILVLSSYKQVISGVQLVAEYHNFLPPFGLSFKIDYLSFLVAAVVSGVWFLVTVYSTEYMAKEHHKNRYYPFLVLTLAGALGVVLSSDLFTFFLFFELMSFTTYVLVIHEETEAAMKAGYKYLILTILGGLALFFAIIAVYELTGTVYFVPGGIIKQSSSLAFFAFIAFFMGFGIKAGVVPLHVWLPEAHPAAPSPASALLSGVVLKTGAYGMIRVVFNIFGLELMRSTGWNNILIAFAVITIILGSAVAISQDDIKRRLAYSSIGQMGYIILGIGLLQEKALVGAIFHIFAHAIMKSSLFLCAGAIIYQTGKKKVSEWQGLGNTMFWTMAVFSIAAISMIGIPPLVGFVTKWEISLGALEAGSWGIILVLLLSALMNFIYYFPVIQRAFFGNGHQKVELTKVKRELTWLMLLPLLVLAGIMLFVDLLPKNFALDLAEKAASMLFSVVK
ncbi:MAG: proton-conducting transporter membrane subunit [bacterium]|nr:proton-conducting transporter membrane subunit [bacterium]